MNINIIKDISLNLSPSNEGYIIFQLLNNPLSVH
jgi:hypothetical protein